MIKFSCKQCNHPFEIFPPDKTRTKAESNECVVNGSGLMKCDTVREYECENCYETNYVYWHLNQGHEKKLLKKAIEILGDDFSRNNAYKVEY